jgi:hypothetical protein
LSTTAFRFLPDIELSPDTSTMLAFVARGLFSARALPLVARVAPVVHARGLSAIASTLARRVPPSSSALQLGVRARGLCTVTVDKTCRVYSCKVEDDKMAHQLDLLMDEFVEHVENVEGYAGAARLVCKSEWDYKLIVKFADLDSLKNFMANVHPSLKTEFNPRIEALIAGPVHEQNFVYDDIE